jgi:TolB-like protein/Flp pilus assembly protein TadD
LFRELRRRKVLRTAAFYLVGAWVLLQVCELVFDILQFPDAAMQLVLAATIVGFPVALIFGWKYDITPQGIKRTPSATEDEQLADLSLKRTDFLLLSAVAIIAVVIVFQVPLPTDIRPASQGPVENSIAVLPFTVCDDREEETVLAAGLAMEVINRLAERRQFKVVARASSFAFAGLDLPPSQIAEPLGVRYILTGILCRGGDSRTLSAELFDEAGFIVWSNRYEQAVDSTGQITQKLASLVANGVATELGDVLASKSGTAVNKLAYEQLVIGREHKARGDEKQARAAFERALIYQPDYAEALYEIALLQLNPTISRNQGTGVANARHIAEGALVLVRSNLEDDVGTAHTHFVAGRIIAALAHWDEELIWRRSGDLDEQEIAVRKAETRTRYAESESHFRTSIRLNPAVTETYWRLADVVEAQGRANEALELYEQALISDPFNMIVNANIAKRWAARGRFRQAIELLERFNDLPEIPPGAWWWRLELMSLQVYWDEKCATLIEMLLHNRDAFEALGNRWQAWWFVSQLAELGLYEEAEAWKIRIENMPMRDWMRRSGLTKYLMATGRSDEVIDEHQSEAADMSDEEVLNAFHEAGIGFATALAGAGDFKRAIELMVSLRHAPALVAEREARAPLVLAAMYQRVGRDDEALPLLETVVANLEAEFDSGIRHPETLTLLAEAYARQNRDEAAINMLRKAVDYHERWLSCSNDESSDAELFYTDAVMPNLFNSSPTARLGDDPRIIALCERIDADLEQQASRIRKMLAEHDIDELLSPLMALAEDAAADAEQRK